MEGKGNNKFSEKVNSLFGGLLYLTISYKALLLILCIMIFPAYCQVGPSSTDDILEVDAENS